VKKPKLRRRRAARPEFGEDIVLSPQSELPRHPRGQDRSRPSRAAVEMGWPEFDRKVSELAKAISRKFKPEAVIGVAHGGVFVGGALASAMAVEFFPVRISRRSRDKAARGRPKAFGEIPREVKGRRVLVVDDVAASGETLELACALTRSAGAKETRTATLVRREQGFSPDFSPLATDELVIFPWDYSEVAEDMRFGAPHGRKGR
jgi:hypoxanthine phosphoribosyltransferase